MLVSPLQPLNQFRAEALDRCAGITKDHIAVLQVPAGLPGNGCFLFDINSGTVLKGVGRHGMVDALHTAMGPNSLAVLLQLCKHTACCGLGNFQKLHSFAEGEFLYQRKSGQQLLFTILPHSIASCPLNSYAMFVFYKFRINSRISVMPSSTPSSR